MFEQPLWLWIALIPAIWILAHFDAACAQEPESDGFDWQKPQAKILPGGDLQWAPEPFEFTPGKEVRYIDYDSGDDTNPGTRDKPWKHHPWDPRAKGKAAQAGQVDTYVFKAGVVYRGSLQAPPASDGAPKVQLTADPSWGQGQAVLSGAMVLGEGWSRLEASQAPEGLDPANVWVREVQTSARPWTLWRVEDDEVIRLKLARTPNWKEVDPEDNKSQWYIWDQQKGTVKLEDEEVNFGQDTENITFPKDALEDAFVYSEWGPVMGTPAARQIIHYQPDRSTIYFRGFWGKNPNGMFGPMRYYLENSPYFLDEPDEWWLEEGAQGVHKLYLRLEPGQDPNRMHLEAGVDSTIIELASPAGRVEVSGLTFRFSNVPKPSLVFELAEDRCRVGCVKLVGSAKALKVANCTFEYVGMPIYAKAVGEEDLLEDVRICDNDIRQTDLGAMVVEDGSFYMIRKPPKGTLGNVDILRNRMYRIGFRPQLGTHGHAVILKFPETAHVAGNMLHRGYGAGLFIFGGRPNVFEADAPLARILIHHNRVVDPLINTNDWGGIETWQGGTHYVYNNVSGNPGGYWNFAKRRFGFAYYLDGSFKNYHFNNIAWGISSEEGPHGNTSAFQEIFSYQNTFFHNSVYNFVVGSRRQSPTGSRDIFAANVWEDMGKWVFWHGEESKGTPQANQEHVGFVSKAFRYETNAYTRNVFAGSADNFGIFEADGGVHGTLDSMAQALARRGALASDIGQVMASSPYVDSAGHDFRLKPSSKALGSGIRMFVPWTLASTVGEWNFRLNRSNPARILDDHWFMRSYYPMRNYYYEMPTANLEGHGIAEEDFIQGPLEDWTPSALEFNGRDQYARLSHQAMTQDITYNQGQESIPGSRRVGLDMRDNNFCIELFLRVKKGATRGTVLSKSDGTTGYQLRLDDHGDLMLVLETASPWDVQLVGGEINDGKWHHVLAEVDRSNSVARMYFDGVLNGKLSLKELGEQSLSNKGDFLLGRSPEGDYFAGALDFLRISRGTLADARTSIEELRAWQFEGPAIRDFTGRKRSESTDAGALEASRP